MEHRLLSAVNFTADQTSILSPQSTTATLSLITNPSTSVATLSSLLETLNLHLRNPNSNHREILSLLSTLSDHHPCLRGGVSAAAHAFILLPSAPTPALPHALSLLDPANSIQPDPFSDESLFLSLCFWQCVKTRRWMLRNVCRFRLRPSVLLTVLLGFTKDPYPYIREAALDGLVTFGGSVVVEDRSLIDCCYFRAVELLFDAENSIRLSAVSAVSEWGQLLVNLSGDESKSEWSDALFVQLCLMVRDSDMEVRVAAFNALGKIQSVSEDILLQTLSKKALPAIKDRSYPGQYTAKVFKIPAAAAAFTFVHGLEDEFYQVRKSACAALQMLTVLSAEFGGGAVRILMDMLNDDSVVVRLQALETLHHMAMHDHLKVEESHLHMFLGTLLDNNASIRSAARKSLQLTKLQKLAMFRSCIDGLIKNLELYQQDETDVFYVLYKIGRAHGRFVTSIIQEVSQKLEPSFDGKLGLNKVTTAAFLVLAISAPVSFERKMSSIPPQIYSYAVILLDRLSSALVDVMDQNTLLTYLSHCSRFTLASASENFDKDSYLHPCKNSSGISDLLAIPVHDYLMNVNMKAESCVEVIFQRVVDLWPLLQIGCTNQAIRALRSWKEELRNIIRDPHQHSSILPFALNYIHVIKLLVKTWTCYLSQKDFHIKGKAVMEALLGKTERKLKEMLYRYIGLSKGEILHILELMLVTYALRLSCGGTCCFDDCIKKLNLVLRRVESLQKEESVEPSPFVQTISREIGNSEDFCIDKLHKLQKSLQLFSLKQIVLSQEIKYIDAEVDICDNNFLNPLPFISGLPVGIPLNVTLHNVSIETRLWVAIAVNERATQFVFLDLHEFGGCDEIRKFEVVAPFYRTPKVKCFSLKVSVAMECLSEGQQLKRCNGPKHELIYLCKGKEVYLSMGVL